MLNLSSLKFYYSSGESTTSSGDKKILVFTPRNLLEEPAIAALARQELLTSLGPTAESNNTPQKRDPRKIISSIINRFISNPIEWCHYQSGKAAEIIRKNLNSQNPDPKLLEITRYKNNLVATILAQAKLILNQLNRPENYLEIYRPYFDITTIPEQVAQTIREVIKNSIHDYINNNQEANDDLINTIANQIIDQLKQLVNNSSESDSKLILQIQQILQDPDLLFSLKQVVQEILSSLEQINPSEVQRSEQTNHQAGLNNLDTIINQLEIVLATQPTYSAEAEEKQQSLRQRLLKKLRPFMPVAWIVGPVLSLVVGLTAEPDAKWNPTLTSIATSGILGFVEGWEKANSLLEIAAEARAANNPEQPFNNKQKPYQMISARDLLINIEKFLQGSGSTQSDQLDPSQPTLTKPQLLEQIHLIRIIWNEYQLPILKNDFKPKDLDSLEKVKELVKQYGITLNPEDRPMIFYRNLLLLVEVLGIELIQQSKSAENLQLNSAQTWHIIGLSNIKDAIRNKLTEIKSALSPWKNPRIYLSHTLDYAIISALFSSLFYEIGSSLTSS